MIHKSFLFFSPLFVFAEVSSTMSVSFHSKYRTNKKHSQSVLSKIQPFTIFSDDRKNLFILNVSPCRFPYVICLFTFCSLNSFVFSWTLFVLHLHSRFEKWRWIRYHVFNSYSTIHGRHGDVMFTMDTMGKCGRGWRKRMTVSVRWNSWLLTCVTGNVPMHLMKPNDTNYKRPNFGGYFNEIRCSCALFQMMSLNTFIWYLFGLWLLVGLCFVAKCQNN